MELWYREVSWHCGWVGKASWGRGEGRKGREQAGLDGVMLPELPELPSDWRARLIDGTARMGIKAARRLLDLRVEDTIKLQFEGHCPV